MKTFDRNPGELLFKCSVGQASARKYTAPQRTLRPEKLPPELCMLVMSTVSDDMLLVACEDGLFWTDLTGITVLELFSPDTDEQRKVLEHV